MLPLSDDASRRLLAPLGAHRRAFITPSKGKRRRARQKKSKAPDSEAPAAESPFPPVPELAAYVDVGLSKISRTLQLMAGQDAGPAEPTAAATTTTTTPQGEAAGSAAPYSVVFVARGGQSSAFHSHFPQMVGLAARSQTQTQTPPGDRAVRLVSFSSRACEERLSAALGLPRVSSIALREGAPGPQAEGLVGFVRERVAPVRVAWLDEARSAEFLGTKIDAVPTRVGTKKPRLS